MALIANGVTVPTNVANILNINGVNITEVVANGVQVWLQNLYSGGPSPQVFSVSTTLVAGTHFPADTTINVCMIGGGGSGGSGNNCNHGGGGYAGAIATGTFTKVAGQSIVATIGAGGPTAYGWTNGNAGGSSSLGTILTASGGAGGVANSASYGGNGGSRTTCGGTFTDGIYMNYQNCDISWGGQAGFGNGGNGGSRGSGGSVGVKGSGGGGSMAHDGAYPTYAGGNGLIILSW